VKCAACGHGPEHHQGSRGCKRLADGYCPCTAYDGGKRATVARVRTLVDEWDKTHEDTCSVYPGQICNCRFGDLREALGLERLGW